MMYVAIIAVVLTVSWIVFDALRSRKRVDKPAQEMFKVYGANAASAPACPQHDTGDIDTKFKRHVAEIEAMSYEQVLETTAKEETRVMRAPQSESQILKSIDANIEEVKKVAEEEAQEA
jgi:hypothetical protein